MTSSDPSATPLRWLGELGRRNPDAWSGIERLRGMRGRELPNFMKGAPHALDGVLA